MKDIVDDLRNAIAKDSSPWDETLYERAADEIEHLRSLITAWADAEDEADMIRGIDLFTAYEALRKAVGR
jgi:hypothetical protein